MAPVSAVEGHQKQRALLKEIINMMITKKEMQLITESTLRKRKMNSKNC